MAVHWLGEAVTRNCAFKPLVESSSLSALTQSQLDLKSGIFPTPTCPEAGFLFNGPTSAVFEFESNTRIPMYSFN